MNTLGYMQQKPFTKEKYYNIYQIYSGQLN